MSKRTAALFLLALVPVTAFAQAPPSYGPGVDSAAQALMQQYQIPGMELAVVDHGRIAYAKGYGVDNLATKRPVAPTTQFEIGSITKQFTAAAILQLKEQGALTLSDPLGKYIPEYAAAKYVTIEQLLWQTSGIYDYVHTPNIIAIASHKSLAFNGFLALVKDKPLDFEPGTKWEYSNTNYVLLGRIIEIVSHGTWESYLRKSIFAPVGMKNTAFVRDEPTLPSMATGYEQHRGKVVPSPLLHAAFGLADGDIVSTVGDIARWDNAFLAGKIVTPEDVKLATTSGKLASGEDTGYGFGWSVDSVDGQARIWHDGGMLGFGSGNAIYPNLGQAFIVLENKNILATPEAISEFTDTLLETVNPQIATVQHSATAGEDPKMTALARATLQAISTGTIDRTTLTARYSDHLTPQLLAQAASQLGPLGPWTSFDYRGASVADGVSVYTYDITWRGAGVQVTMAMNVDAAGKIDALSLHSKR